MAVDYSPLLVGARLNAQNALTPGSSTHPPTIDAVNQALEDRPTADDLTQLRLDIGAQVAQKQDPLSVAGLATLEDNVLTVSAPEVTGRINDGSSWFFLPGLNGFDVVGPRGGAPTTVGTVTVVGPNSPTNSWNARTRAYITGTAGQPNQARLALPLKVRAPANSTTPYGGYHIVFTLTTGDSISGRTAGGVFQVVPSLGTNPSAYTGARFMIASNLGDTTMRVYAGGTLVQDLGSDFPAGGNEENTYECEIWSKPYPNYGVYWRVTNTLTNATASGTQTSNIPIGDHDPYFCLVRDSGVSTSACRIVTSGGGGGAYVAQVMGEAVDDLAPTEIASATVLTKASHGYREVDFNSATPFVVTLSDSDWAYGDILRGTNNGAGAVTFAAAGGLTIAAHANVPATVEQNAGWMVKRREDDWLRLA